MKGANTEPHSGPPPRLKTTSGPGVREEPRLGRFLLPCSRRSRFPRENLWLTTCWFPEERKTGTDWKWQEEKKNRPPRLEPPMVPPAPSLFSRSGRRSRTYEQQNITFWARTSGSMSKQTGRRGALALIVSQKPTALCVLGPSAAGGGGGAASGDFGFWSTHDATKLENSYWIGLRPRRGRVSEKMRFVFFGSSKRCLSSNSTRSQW